MSLTEVEAEITRLSDIWMRFVGQDHHKDRDCHWYIEKYYSYGKPPYYQAYHNGYIGDKFEGSECTTIEEAEEELLNAIKFRIHDAKIWVTRNLEEARNGTDFYFGSVEEYETMLAILEEA